MCRRYDSFTDHAERVALAREIAAPSRETRVYADAVWKDGKAVPDTEGVRVHPDDYIHDPMRNC